MVRLMVLLNNNSSYRSTTDLAKNNLLVPRSRRSQRRYRESFAFPRALIATGEQV